MTALSDLLRDVLNAPDEDAPRIAYADYMATQPDASSQARALFIRAQLELAGLEPRSKAAFEQTGEVLRLLDAHGASWTASVRQYADDPVFDRGFVELVRCTGAGFLAHAHDLLALAPIRHLTLTSVDDLDALLASPHLAQIRSLALDRVGLTDPMLATLATSPGLAQLRWLSIANNAVTRVGAESLAGSRALPRLAYVRFYGNPFDPGERQGHDQGMIVDRWLPKEGRDLEAKFGHLRWLHTDAQTLDDVVPDRLRIG